MFLRARVGAVNNYAGPIGVHAWANQEHGGTNLGETVPLSPAPLATKETSGIGQCCQRLEPLPALRQERRQRRHSRNGDVEERPSRLQMRNKGRPVWWGTCGRQTDVGYTPAFSGCVSELSSHTGGFAGSPPSLPRCPSPACFKENRFLGVL